MTFTSAGDRAPSPRRAPRGDSALRSLLPALVISSGLGYAVQLLAPLLLSTGDYVVFSAFWSSLFLGIAALSGVQNEVARSVTDASGTGSIAELRVYTLVIVGACLVGGSLIGVATSFAVDAEDSFALGTTTALGLCSFAALAVIVGTFYGRGRWKSVALSIIADPAARALAFLALVVLVGALGSARIPLWLVLLATVLPFVVATMLLWFAGGRESLRLSQIEGTWRGLLGRSFHTVVAASALGFMAAGQPLLIASIGKGENSALVAGIILVVVLVRAPLVSPLIALQSFMTVSFRAAGKSMIRRLVAVVAGVSAVTAVAAVVIGVWGEEVGRRFLTEYTLPGATILVCVVVSSGLVGIQCVVGAAVLATSRHRGYAAGWLVTALSAVILSLLPLSFDVKLGLVLIVPVLAGLAVHMAVLVAPRSGPTPPV